MGYSARFKIPLERVGVLVGPNGSVRKKIEKLGKVTLMIDSETGEVEIIHQPNLEDPTLPLRVQSVVNAIGRGFAAEKSLSLMNEGTILEIIDIRDFVGKSRENINRLKGRVIGRDGKARRIIEETSDAEISVYGHTIALLGGFEEVGMARDAILKLLEGGQHKTIYQQLGKMRHEMKKERLKLWEKPGEG